MNTVLVRPVGRRDFLLRSAAGGAYLLWSGSLPATPECRETEDNDEGPFYKKGAPDRETLLEGSIAGTRLSLKGRVMSTSCVPLAGAVLDVWQADDNGQYDNSGFTLRGKFHADKSGVYRIETIVPKHYRIGGDRMYRPAHIHLKISASGCPMLTTQLYFQGDRYNKVDSLFRPSLVLSPKEVNSRTKAAEFDFILKQA
jgi:protocatechuate 3,4-dioxygenase beta subunit